MRPECSAACVRACKARRVQAAPLPAGLHREMLHGASSSEVVPLDGAGHPLACADARVTVSTGN